MKLGYSFIDDAQDEYDASVSWYAERSIPAANGFISAVEEALELVCNNPSGWRNEYEDYYELALKKYPFSLVYSLDDKLKLIVVKSIYHHSRDPNRKYKK